MTSKPLVKAMSQIVDRELARARSRGAVRHKPALSTELAPLVRSLVATLSRTSAGARVSFDPQVPADLLVPMDRTDLAEVLGNVLDNAARHAASRVRIAASRERSGASIIVEDDGAGIPPAAGKRHAARRPIRQAHGRHRSGAGNRWGRSGHLRLAARARQVRGTRRAQSDAGPNQSRSQLS